MLRHAILTALYWDTALYGDTALLGDSCRVTVATNNASFEVTMVPKIEGRLQPRVLESLVSRQVTRASRKEQTEELSNYR